MRQNTTIIVFHCGNFERIGIRHRESQTLFLSNLIDVVHCKDPAHGKLHTGLFIAAIEDGLDRARELREMETASKHDIPTPPKRPAEDSNPDERRTRQKTTADETQENAPILLVDPVPVCLYVNFYQNRCLTYPP